MPIVKNCCMYISTLKTAKKTRNSQSGSQKQLIYHKRIFFALVVEIAEIIFSVKHFFHHNIFSKCSKMLFFVMGSSKLAIIKLKLERHV